MTTIPIPRTNEMIESGAFVVAGIAAVPATSVVNGFVGCAVATTVVNGFDYLICEAFATAIVAWMPFCVGVEIVEPETAGSNWTPVFENISSTPTVLKAVERATAAALSFTLPVPVKLKITAPVLVFTTSPE